MRKIALISIAIGLISRFILAFTLPLWADEAYSIWIIDYSFSVLFSAVRDPVHPPLYYIFLKIFSFVSDHLFWFRSINIGLFVINLFLIKEVARKFANKKKEKVAYLAVIFYSLSGYFLIFDWQVRMYTGVVTLILLSLLFWKKNNFKALFIALSFGLLFDYGFLWFYIVFLLFQFYKLIESKKKIIDLKKKTVVTILSSISFILWRLWTPTTLQSGIGGISWMLPYLKPSFYYPYFAGTHHPILFLIFLFSFGFFMYRFFKLKSSYKNNILLELWLGSLGLMSVLLIVSVLYSPIFHVRSLQIVSLFAIFIFSQIISISKKREIIGIFVFLVINLIYTVLLHYKHPGRLLIQFFPGKRIHQELSKQSLDKVSYSYKGKLATPLLEWGLRYTFLGKESFISRKIKLKKLTSYPSDCKLIHQRLVDFFDC